MDADVDATASAAADPTTGLPVDVLPYAPDVAVYDAMLERNGPPRWLDELDLRPGPPHVHVGTHATTLDAWLLPDEARSMELSIRNRLLDERREVVVGCRPTAEPAAAAVRDLVVGWLDDHGVAHDPPDPAEHPLVAVGRLVQEDVCLMVRRDGDWHLDGGVLCFPTLWQLHERMGLPTSQVHERVAHYDTVEQRVDRFFDRLPPDRVVWRRNVSVKPYPHLHVPTVKTEMPAGGHAVAPDGSPYWIRTERQTLRRLPGIDAIAFTIRVQTVRAAALLERPDIAAAMAAHLRSWDAPFRAYKFAGSDLFVAFVDWLDDVAAGRAGSG